MLITNSLPVNAFHLINLNRLFIEMFPVLFLKRVLDQTGSPE